MLAKSEAVAVADTAQKLFHKYRTNIAISPKLSKSLIISPSPIPNPRYSFPNPRYSFPVPLSAIPAFGFAEGPKLQIALSVKVKGELPP